MLLMLEIIEFRMSTFPLDKEGKTISFGIILCISILVVLQIENAGDKFDLTSFAIV